MTQYSNELTGALFKNEKNGNESRPDYRGSAEIDRVQYWVSGWIKVGKKDGAKYMSLKFEPKQAKDIKGAVAQKAPATVDEFNDEVPF